LSELTKERNVKLAKYIKDNINTKSPNELVDEFFKKPGNKIFTSQNIKELKDSTLSDIVYINPNVSIEFTDNGEFVIDELKSQIAPKKIARIANLAKQNVSISASTSYKYAENVRTRYSWVGWKLYTIKVGATFAIMEPNLGMIVD